MTITEVLVEGKSATEYLAAAIRWYDSALLPFLGKIKDGGGYSEIEERLQKAQSQGSDKSLFIVWDGDVLSRKGKLPIQAVIDHQPAYSFQRDFEAIFPDWMLVEALAIFDPTAGYPQEEDLRRFWNTGGGRESGYDRLVAGIRANAIANGRDPASFVPPGKVELCRCLARVASRTQYQPPEIRYLFNMLMAHTSGRTQPATRTTFVTNQNLIKDWALSGRIAFHIHEQIMLLEMPSGTLSTVVDKVASGPPNWSPSGNTLAFPSIPTSQVRNNEAVQVVDMRSMKSQEFLRIGHYLCWDKSERLYGNTSGSDGYVVTRLDPLTKDRSVLNLPDSALVACVDRDRDRILVGEQGRPARRLCGMFRLNDDTRVWDSSACLLPLAEYTAPSISPNGRYVSWPIQEPGNERSSLWTTSIEEKPTSKRLTGREGRVQTSTWSPDGEYVAFMWSRWPNDPIRMWVARIDTLQLAPLLDGPFRDAGLNALGCHSWAGTPAP